MQKETFCIKLSRAVAMLKAANIYRSVRPTSRKGVSKEIA